MFDRITPYLSICEELREIRYLGYALKLTPNEYEVVRAVIANKDGADKKRIAEELPEELCFSDNCISVHICAINKKACLMGGRKLIKFDRKRKYYIDNRI